MLSRIGVVGHHTWFSNHFPEGWENDQNVLCLDVNERDYNFLIKMKNFWPDITLFYRPELYPRAHIEAIPGKRIAILSEPIPYIDHESEIYTSSETDLRVAVYQGMQWDLFDRIYYYDSGKKRTIERFGWPISGFHPMPIDINHFRPSLRNRPIDVFFIGKATPRRIAIMDFLRTANLRFVWVAHGVHGRELAYLFRRSKLVLNVHADDLPATEPRLFLAAACGCAVLTDLLPERPEWFSDQIFQFKDALTQVDIDKALQHFMTEGPIWNSREIQKKIGVRNFINANWKMLASAGSI